ncbi:MAG TPA: SpoIID/LytB domain-containing protein, partial [bacterium]|nr:SpoIID/LytB domain-containing protein [bacterium]
MYNQTDLHANYLNYHLSHKKAVAKKSTSLAAVLNLAIVFLIAIFFAQLLSTWRFEADARDLVTLLAAPVAQAAEPVAAGEAQPYTTNLIMKADQETTVSLTFINKGQTTWAASKTTLETGPFLKTISKVYHRTWLKAFQVMTLPKNVKPGEKIILSFKISGPEAKYIGVIQENFQLVTGEQPIKGSLARVFIDANQVTKAVVTENVKTVATTNVKTVSTPSTKIQYITAYNKLGEKVQVVKGQYVAGVSLTKPSTKAIAAEKSRLAAITQTTVVVAVATSTNQDNNTYCIALSASERAVSPKCQTSNDESQAGSGITNFSKKLDKQPLIRVGLFDSTSTQKITSDKAFNLYAASNMLVANIAAGTLVSVNYSKDNQQYTADVNGKVYQTKDYLRFVSQSGNDGIFQLPDYRNNPNWNANLNDNKFRNVLEYRYTPKTNKVWWINELPVDSYLKGMAETSNASPVEFHKVMATAARTYVLYHYYRGVDFGLVGASTKHADEFFHVDAT